MKNYSKAAAGFVAAAIVAYLGASDGGVTGQEWLTILLAGIGGSGLVFVAPKNRPKNEAGQIHPDLALMLTILTFVGVVLLLFKVHFGG